MPDEARFTITTLPPSVNDLYTRDHRLSKKGRSWKRAVAMELMGQRGIRKGPFYWSASVMIPGRGVRGDMMNFEKALTDSLCDAGLVPDDRYLVWCKYEFWRGDDIVVDVKKENFSTWADIKGASKHTERIMRQHYS